MQQIIVTVSRYILALLFIVFGLNGIFGFFQIPPPESPAAQAFLGGLASSGYFFPFLKVTEVFSGLMLLSCWWTPLGLLILAPIVINILLFHIFVGGIQGLELLILLLHIFVVWGFRERFRSVFTMLQEVK